MKMRTKALLLRHSRKLGHVRHTSLARHKRNLFLLGVIVGTVVIYIGSRLLSANRSLRVLVRFSDKEKLNPGEKEEEYTLLIERKNQENENIRKSLERSHTPDIVTSPKRRFLLSPRKSRWRMNPSKKCANSNPFLLILISSHESMTSLRDVIRNTWCKNKVFSDNRNILCIFVVGQDEKTEDTPGDVAEEYITHRDIIKQSFIDSFRNSSWKLMVGFQWIKEYCPGARYVMKTEDDVILNNNFIMNKLLVEAESENYFVGKCWSDQPIRNRQSKYYVSEEQFAGDRYPMYCSKTGYIMSADVTKRLYSRTIHEKDLLPLDDVFVGVQLQKINVTPVNIPGFLHGRYDETNICDNVSNVATIHAHGMDTQHVWDLIHKKCPL